MNALLPVEADLLCAFAEVAAPFPLDVPADGHTETERRHRYRAARERLTARGLADRTGPRGVAEDFVFLLHACTGVVDLVLATERPVLAAVLLTHRDRSLLVTQDLADPDRVLRLSTAGDLTTLVPRLDAPPTAPVHLPRRVLDGEAEVDDRVAGRMVSLLGSVLGNGQAGNARRDDSPAQWRRDGDELRWLDTGRGRLRLTADADWVSVNPLPHATLRAELRRLAARAR